MLRPNVITGSKKRLGRGFTVKELESAGLSFHQAKLLEVSIDRHRTTSHEDNVKVLKYLKSEAQKVAKKGE